MQGLLGAVWTAMPGEGGGVEGYNTPLTVGIGFTGLCMYLINSSEVFEGEGCKSEYKM